MEKTKKYSGLFIIIPEKQDTVEEVTTAIDSIIDEGKGSIIENNVIGKKVLAYPIKKKTEGIYYEVVFNAEPGSIAGMTRQFNINTNILRSLIDKAV